MRGSCRRVNPIRKHAVHSNKSKVTPMKLLTVERPFQPSDASSDDDAEHKKVEETDTTIVEFHQSVLAHSSKKDIKLMRGKLLSMLPIFTHKVARKTNTEIKSKESKVLDLVEQGFPASAKYLQGLFDIESEFRSHPDNVADFENWPRLSKEKPLLDVIVSGLQEAEHARRRGRRLLELGSWLFIAVFTALRKKCWYWVSDFLFKMTIRVAKSIKASRKREAYIRFTYAQFLTKKMELQIKALQQFNRVRKMSANAEMDGIDLLHLNEFDSDLHSQACFYLNKICKNLAKELRIKNPYLSIKLSLQAEGFLKLAFHNITHTKVFSEYDSAMYELALSYMAAEEYNSALIKLQKYEVKCREESDKKGICKALYMKAQCYLQMKKRHSAVEDLLMLCDMAENCNFPDLLTLGQLELASISLNFNSLNALEVLKGATSVFISSHNLEDIEYRQRARCVCGIAEGQYLWPFYISMIKETNNNNEAFNKLLEWKFCKTPFMESQIQTFAIQTPRRSLQMNYTMLDQIQKFVLPEKLLDLLGEYMPFSSKYYSISPLDN